MEKIDKNIVFDESILFNGPLETGLRALIILEEAHPQRFDLTTLTWLDYLVVHTEDIDGPISLHPDISFRSGELLVRRRIIENGLTLMRHIHLVRIEEMPEGLFYSSTEYAMPALNLMCEKYNLDLKARAKWLIQRVDEMSLESLKAKIRDRMGLWNNEIQQKVQVDNYGV